MLQVNTLSYFFAFFDKKKVLKDWHLDAAGNDGNDVIESWNKTI